MSWRSLWTTPTRPMPRHTSPSSVIRLSLGMLSKPTRKNVVNDRLKSAVFVVVVVAVVIVVVVVTVVVEVVVLVTF